MLLILLSLDCRVFVQGSLTGNKEIEKNIHKNERKMALDSLEHGWSVLCGEPGVGEQGPNFLFHIRIDPPGLECKGGTQESPFSQEYLESLLRTVYKYEMGINSDRRKFVKIIKLLQPRWWLQP